MSEHVLSITSPGPLSTIQDAGRAGYQRFGVSTSGAADQPALLLGNRLAGNDPGAPALEVTFGGFEAQFEAATAFAITGGDLGATLNGTEIPRYTVLRSQPGDELAMVSPRSGLRAYLCVAGGFEVPLVLGSAATYIPGRMGGLNGGPLQAGDRLISPGPTVLPDTGTILDGTPPLNHPSSVVVRVIPGPQQDQFTDDGTDTFFGSEYTVSDRSDRQGIRFIGPEIEAGPDGYDIVSDAIATGSIQIPGDRKPIALLADRQTTGGYPKIGVVATVDLPLLAQAAPGTTVRFARTTVDEAVEALREQAQEIERAVPVPPQLDTISLGVGGEPHKVVIPNFGTAASQQDQNLMQVEVDGKLYTVSIRKDS